MADWTSQHTTAEAIQKLEEARIPCGPIYDLDTVLADPHIQTRELLKHVEYPGAAKPVPMANTPVRLSETPGAVRHRAPTLGEHTDEVMRELGFSGEEIEDFRAAGVI